MSEQIISKGLVGIQEQIDKIPVLKTQTISITTDQYGQFTLSEYNSDKIVEIWPQSYKYYIVRYSTNFVVIARVDGVSTANITLNVKLIYWEN